MVVNSVLAIVDIEVADFIVIRISLTEDPVAVVRTVGYQLKRGGKVFANEIVRVAQAAICTLMRNHDVAYHRHLLIGEIPDIKLRVLVVP